jgi:hypothetical protein
MGKVHVDMSMSLDGFVAGPNASPHNALGDGGHRIQQWLYDVESWRERQSLEGGQSNRDDEVYKETSSRSGAYVMGRRMFDEGEVDEEATEVERKKIRENRIGWLEADAEELARRYRDGEIGALELIRRHGVILDWGTGELLRKTTEGFRAMLKRRVVPHWENGAPKD